MTRRPPPDLPHPALRFSAPAHITKGQPLKALLDGALLQLIGESFAAVTDRFDAARFCRRGERGLDQLELADRGRHIAAALAGELPAGFADALPIFLAALGPRATQTSDLGLSPFFYFPHSHWVSAAAGDDLQGGLLACYELTQRFTAEFCIRPLIERDAATVLQALGAWVRDPDPHVRRLVSEGTRPRLPWARRLRDFVQDPRPTLPLLEALKIDPSLYVRRSVANHMGDIAKDHLELALARCGDWLEQAGRLQPEPAKQLRWVIRHALRNPAKQGQAEALALREAAR
ncbi:MAG: DNA alkylation repair protein [Planctomycetota bacterium]|nr:MAG: DNA alkylation repair protein [Planctomycetota bacterium]